ncbi:metallophosphoesterase [Halopiger djelfimassiliensis]|uniref:metallophosphoesterase n=1 Tax=Halopiger djelfimassiliensis TaxID=1293047 RepID=UPI000677F6F8|nr:metallophosphoesterase [Halopiger djelfimassiliensis]
MTPESHLDRRSYMKAAGLAAGTVTLGATMDGALADADHNHVVAASDVHFGSPYSNDDAFVQFLSEDVPDLDPDTLVLNGDLFEFWYRGMSSTLLEYNDVTTQLEELVSSGIEVVVIAGNHDRRLVDVGRDDYDAATLAAPWHIGEEFYFESGGREFVAVHGDGADPQQADLTSALLCAGSDDLGKVIIEFYELINDDDETATTQENTWDDLTENLDIVELLEQPPPVDDDDYEPDAAGERPPAADTVTNELLDEYEEFVVFGHTHYTELGDRFVNTGAWTERRAAELPTRPQNTYVEIENGDVRVLDWSENGSSVLFEE